VIYVASSVAVVRQKGHRHAGRARCTFRERFENKTRIDAGRRDEATTGHSTHCSAFLSPTRTNPSTSSSSSSSSSSLYHPPPCLRHHGCLILLLRSLRDHEGYHDEVEVDEGRRAYAAVWERETIPVEEGPFCPAHPTHGFRRPWSH